MNSIDETDNEMYDIIKNGINKDMSDDEVMRVIKYMMKNLPTYNKIKGTSSAIEMILKMFSLSCKIINLWHTTDTDSWDKNEFQEETAIEDFTDLYLTSKFNVEVYYSNLSFTEFTKNVTLFVKLIDSVKPVTKILNQISYIVAETKDYHFYDCKQIVENTFIPDTIEFTDSAFGTKTSFRKMTDGFFIPSTDSDGNSVYALLLNLVNAPYKCFSLTASNEITENNLYIEIDSVQKSLSDLASKNDEYQSYISNLPTYLSKSYPIEVNIGDDKLEYDTKESGILLKAKPNSGSITTDLMNANISTSIIPTLTNILKKRYNTSNVIVRCTGIEHPTTVELNVNHAKNTYSFGEV